MRRIVRRASLVMLICSLLVSPTSLLAEEVLRVDEDLIFIGPDDDAANEFLRANAPLAWPRVPPDTRPALVFAEGSPQKEVLCVAYLRDGTVRKEEITSAKYISVTQLDNALFLVETSGSPPGARCFALDLTKGMARLLATGNRLHLLRTVPERGKAMLMHYHSGFEEARLLVLDLKTLDVTLQHAFTEVSTGTRFQGIRLDMKVSPDFTRAACAARGSMTLHKTTCDLDVVDLTTGETRCFAEDVRVRLGSFSSIAFGRPPLEWISNEEIVYQHMPAEPNGPSELHQGTYILNRVNLTTHIVTTVLQDQLPLTIDGGSLWVNPLNGELTYNDTWILDPVEGTLTSKNHPYSIGNAIEQCVSPSHLHIAYTLRPKATHAEVTIYMRLNGRDEPLEVGRGPYLPTRPIGWIE